MGEPAHQARNARWLGQPDLPLGRADDRAPADCRGICGAGGKGTRVASETRAIAASRDSNAAGSWRADAELSLEVVDLSLASRGQGEAREHPRFERTRIEPREISHCVAKHRPGRWTAARTA